ncbi:MAG: zinc carboxypeptidase [Erysipelotrichaceae bacterium]|nr:zinc carboxypeptidase [Erysipelotrichaceae bacterium]
MKTTFTYDHYYKYDELKNVLETLQNKYPDLMELDVNCVTEENRNQYVATLSNKKIGEAINKPALYIDGNIHAGEVTASMCALHTIDYLLTNYATDKDIQKLLDESTVYVVPRVTPDGAETYLSTPYTLRSVNREYLKKDGGIKESDLDDDGVIRMMRIPTPYGAWKKDPEDPELMILRDPSDNVGQFYDIYPEGLFEKYDGDENLKARKNDWGLDFNRNFPYGWFPEGRQDGAGNYPLSNIETKAIVDFVLAHPNIAGAAIGHTSGGMILCPPGTKPSAKAPAYDNKVIKAIAKMGEEELGYKAMNIFDTFLSSQEFYDSGALDDWMYETQGIPAYTMEFWDVASKAGMPYDWENKKNEDDEKELKRFAAILKWTKENAPKYYSSFKEYDHPTFGKVEIGGFNYKFTHQNPPEDLLIKELEADTRFNIRFLKALPKLVIEDVTKEKLSDDIYKISATIGNLGYLSTNLTEAAVNIKVAKPVEVTIDGCEVINGLKQEKIDELSGYSRTVTGVFYYGNITTEENAKARKKLSWVVKAEKDSLITIKARHDKAGLVETEIRI